MMSRWILILLLLILTKASSLLLAHDDHDAVSSEGNDLLEGFRTWTHASGRYQVRASYVTAYGEDQIQVRKHDGNLLNIKLRALSQPDQDWVARRQAEISLLNSALVLPPTTRFLPEEIDGQEPLQTQAFKQFEGRVRVRWDDRFLFVESNGIPDHRMMVGITAWQQQVPLPQPYTDSNAWRIPLHPVPAKQPLSAREHFFRGAIALAVNGVPIFNPIKNDGRTDTVLAGELDEFGGHCGRADDYHYHVAPVHLQDKVGRESPVAYALDGYPIYGYQEPDGSEPGRLDPFNGHESPSQPYHYHATKKYPYLNGGFHGEVTDRGGQVDPQPRAEPVREAGIPLRGATIVDFQNPTHGRYSLTYEMRGQKYQINYAIKTENSVEFEYVDAQGNTTRESNRRREPFRLDDSTTHPVKNNALPQPDKPNTPAQNGLRAGAPARKPWMVVHAAEMDTNQDGKLTRTEMQIEAEKTFQGYDQDRNGSLTRAEYEGRATVRSALGGFVKQHAQELDANSDDQISQEELNQTITRMFDKADRNQNGEIDPEEFENGENSKPSPNANTDPQSVEEPAPAQKAQREADSPEQAQRERRPAGARGNARQTDPDQKPRFHTEVPEHPVDLILGRPTNHSVTLSLLAYLPTEAYVTYGPQSDRLSRQSRAVTLKAGLPVEFVLEPLEQDTEYAYQVHYKPEGKTDFLDEDIHKFHTSRKEDKPFTFTVQADSHLDLGTDTKCYVQTLQNAGADHPDFHIDLGDTFMTDKFAEYQDAASQYLAQRYYFGQLCHSSPLFLTLGNHDGEVGYSFDSTENNMAVWSNRMRQRFFPNPHPNEFYSGNSKEEAFIGRPANYYGWQWGDALFVVLDPFLSTTKRNGQANDYWGRTLGEDQYRWLKNTLESSQSRYKFVFIHHLVGGATKEARGGAEAAAYFEWGGRNLDGSWAFDEKRPGWEKPIHQLLVDHKVSAVFHGHDHFYAHQERDGIVYQLVPQPGNLRYGTPRSATEYGYEEGKLLNGPGYLRINVTPAQTKIDYVLTVTKGEEQPNRKNKQVVSSYTIDAAEPSPVVKESSAAKPLKKKPNFVSLIGEGQGWSSLSVPMDDQVPESRSPFIETPNLDKLAREGMRFSHCYAPSPRCTPSRAAFLTGKSPAQLHMTFVSEGRDDDGGGPATRVIPPRTTTELPESETTIAEMLKQAGYATAHFGKWHLGRSNPSRHGYDENDGPNSNGGPDNVRNPNPAQAFATTEKGIAFIEHAVEAGKPFYLQVDQYAGRSEDDARPDTLAAVRKRMGDKNPGRIAAVAVAEDADAAIGQILDKIKKLGISDHTYIIYTTDHGTPGRNPPLSGGKGTIAEGGVRVPLLIRGPGIPAGAIMRRRVSGVDLFPTFLELAGLPAPGQTNLEGGSLVPSIRDPQNGRVSRNREEFVIHFPHYDKDPLGPASAIYLGDYKLTRFYETGDMALYNLAQDPEEQNNLVEELQDIRKKLDERLTGYLEAVHADLPGLNPAPDPSKAAAKLPGDRRGSRGRGNRARTKP